MKRIYLRLSMATAFGMIVLLAYAGQFSNRAELAEKVSKGLEIGANVALDVCQDSGESFMPGMFK